AINKCAPAGSQGPPATPAGVRIVVLLLPGGSLRSPPAKLLSPRWGGIRYRIYEIMHSGQRALHGGECRIDDAVRGCNGAVPAAVGQGQEALVEQGEDEVAVLLGIRGEQVPVALRRPFHERDVKDRALTGGHQAVSSGTEQRLQPVSQPQAAPVEIGIDRAAVSRQHVQRGL